MSSSLAKQIEKSRILIVDDQPKNIQVLASQLSDKGYQVEYSTNGIDALDWVSEEMFDLILLDVMMPEMDGYETCRRIKELDDYAEVPVIFLSAKTEVESLVKGFDSGSVDYMTKPFNSAELFVRVENHLELSHSKRMLNSYNKALREKDKEQKESVRYASRIQRMVMPDEKELAQSLPNSFVLHKQRDIIGGDFYWLKEIDNKVLIVVGDCTGHGVPGAMLTVLCISVLNNVLKHTPIKHTKLFTQQFYSQFESYTHDQSNTFADSVELAVCLLDRETGEVCLVNSNLPMLLISDNEIGQSEELSAVNKHSRFEDGKHFVFLKDKNLNYLESRANADFGVLRFKMNAGDRIYLFSDGIVDQFGGLKGKRLMSKNLMNWVVDFHNLSLPEQKNKFSTALKEWQADYNQIDDIIMVGLGL